jgi:NAD(P)H-hydrate epimerase
MKILSAPQIRAADAHTIANQPISSIDLMERAARACYGWFHQNISRKKTIALVCGKGNNGGDGLALARMLKAAGYQVIVFVVNHTPRESEDFATNYNRLETQNIAPINVTSANQLALFDADIWVDALLGSGLNAPLTGLLAEVVSVLNSKSTQRISIDIPTGLFADDNSTNHPETIFKADVTLTFQAPKFSFMFPEFGRFAGHFVILDIGLSPDFLREVDSPNHFVTEEIVKSMLPARQKFMHKGSFGHAYVVAGSIGKMGAAVLASKAALHSGAGLVTVSVPQCGVQILQTANPEIMVLPDMGTDFLTDIPHLKNASAIGIGPGLGQAPETKMALQKFVKQISVPLVLDADALNLLSESDGWHFLAKNTIVTPHLGELKRMLGKDVSGEEIYAEAKKFVADKKIILVVKGAHTAIYLPSGKVYFNSTGNAGMATAGSGDVLTGIIIGLLAQGLSPEYAAIIGVFYHGKAGDVAVQHFGERALCASALLKALRIE